MPKSSDEITKVLREILSTLRGGSRKERDEADHRERQSQFLSTAAHLATRTGQAAGGLIAGAALATGPNLSGTLWSNAQSLLGSIGGDETMVRQVVRLSGALR